MQGFCQFKSSSDMAGSSSISDLSDVGDFYLAALFDEDELFPISDEKYAQELQLQEPAISSSDMAGSSSISNLSYLDDFYLAVLFDEDELFPISDEKYAQELQLQEALISSSSALIHNNVSSTTESSSKPNEKLPLILRETGQSSESFCHICMDTNSTSEVFQTNGCSHSFCTDCISKYVAAKIQENITMVKCPDLKCKGVIGPELCGSIVPKQVLERWEIALCESLILGSEKVYCPFKDCSEMLVADGEDLVTVTECPSCNRLFCAQCKVVWHAGIECREFQSLNKDERERQDIMLMDLAKNKKWKRCPNCKFFVEKNEGCHHISCRCGYQFCYGCGNKYTNTHVCGQT